MFKSRLEASSIRRSYNLKLGTGICQPSLLAELLYLAISAIKIILILKQYTYLQYS